MKIHGYYAVGAHCFDTVSTDAGPDANTRLVFFITFGISKIRYNRGNGTGACALKRIYPKKKLHQFVVRALPID